MVKQFKRRIETSDIPASAPNLPVNSTLIFCDRESDVAHLVGDHDLRKEVDGILALTPEAAVACQENGLPYLKAESFYPETAFRDVCESMLRFQDSWSEEFDNALISCVPELREYELRPARLHFFFLKVLIDQLFMRAFALAHVIVATGPRRVIYFSPGDADLPGFDLFFRDSTWLHVLPLCAKAYGAPINKLEALAAGPGTVSMGRRLRQSIPEPVKRELLSLRSMGWQGFLGSFWPGHGGHSLLLKPGYDLAPLAAQARRKGIRVIPFSRVRLGSPESEWAPGFAKAWSQISESPAIRNAFVWAGADMWDIAETRLDYFTRKVVPEMLHGFVRASEWLAKKKPAAVGVSSPWEHHDQSILHAARRLNIPTFTFQHGGFEGNCEYIALEMTDLRHADYRFVYGCGTAKYFQQRIDQYEEKRAELITVGSPRLDALAKKAPATNAAKLRIDLGLETDRPLVLYVPTAFTRNHNYLVCGSYPDVPYFEFLQQVLALSNEFSNITFAYKSFPSRDVDPVVKMIAKRFPNVRVISDVPLTSLLAAADVHVFDIASTALLESLLLSKRIILMSDSKNVKMRPEAKQLLEKRAVVTESPAEFCAEIREFLTAGDFSELAAPNLEFLSAYGTHLVDGQSLERTMTALETIWLAGGSRNFEQRAAVCQAK